MAIGDTALQIRGGTVFDYSSFPDVQIGLGADQEPVTVSGTSGARSPLPRA
ncbi:MAG: hypothetical protein MZV70_47035 [Desulfobacterales bacterium]|nr:hypothetical protein [Desulfobacterales bacterium]